MKDDTEDSGTPISDDVAGTIEEGTESVRRTIVGGRRRSLFALVLVSMMATVSPTRLHAFCLNEPHSITLVDERLADTPVTWVCDMEQWWWEYQEYCDLDGSRADLPQCPLVELPEILERLTVATGEDTSFLHYNCEQFVDCNLIREIVPLDWEKEWSSCGLKNREEVLDLAEIGEYLEPGDLAATRNNCGEPSWRRSVVVDAGSPPQVKVLASDDGNWTAVGGRMLSWQKSGDPCCGPSEVFGQWFGEDLVYSSAIRFLVEGGEEWVAHAHSAHQFPTSGLALRFHQSEFANDDVWIEDFEGSVRYDVFAWPPEGFQEILVGDEWCQVWCDALPAPDSMNEPSEGADCGVPPDLAEGPDGNMDSGGTGAACGLAGKTNPAASAGSLALLLLVLILLRRARWTGTPVSHDPYHSRQVAWSRTRTMRGPR